VLFLVSYGRTDGRRTDGRTDGGRRTDGRRTDGRTDLSFKTVFIGTGIGTGIYSKTTKNYKSAKVKTINYKKTITRNYKNYPNYKNTIEKQ
jgi:hypothetical protein